MSVLIKVRTPDPASATATYTFGRRSLPVQPVLMTIAIIPIYRVDRGEVQHITGRAGCCIPYTRTKIIHIDYYNYLRLLEDVIIHTLSDFNIISERVDGFTGCGLMEEGRVYRDQDYKVTMHGLSLNANNDLTFRRLSRAIYTELK